MKFLVHIIWAGIHKITYGFLKFITLQFCQAYFSKSAHDIEAKAGALKNDRKIVIRSFQNTNFRLGYTNHF